MTARHSPLFTLRSGQSGLGIFTSGRDAAQPGPLSDRNGEAPTLLAEGDDDALAGTCGKPRAAFGL